jgi:glyoxylase-like metal-dependent hydrolase (beta-lactamase superfamily II)
MNMKIKEFRCNPFAENTYLLYDETGEAIIIDCGCLYDDEKTIMANFISKNNLTIKHLINTHLHIDHIFGNEWAARTFGVLPQAHQADEFLIEQAVAQARLFGIYEEVKPQALGNYLNEGDLIRFGNQELQILHVPGHSAGSLCFYSEKESCVIVGDVLFRGSIGRTDLPGGNYAQLISQINSKLLTLPDETTVYSGHGISTTIGQERRTNPFLQ